MAVSAKISFCCTEFDVGLQEADCRQRGRGHPRVRDEREAQGCEASGWVAEGTSRPGVVSRTRQEEENLRKV